MVEHRRRALEEVDAKVAAGLTIDGWRTLVVDPEDLGVMELEGQELEDALADGELAWADEEYEALHAADDADVAEMGATEGIVEALPGDDPLEVQEALVAEKRLS